MKSSTETYRVPTGSGEMLLRWALWAQDGERGIREYGVTLVNETTGERAQVRGLTTREEAARDFTARLARGKATTVSLRELAEDFIVEI